MRIKLKNSIKKSIRVFFIPIGIMAMIIIAAVMFCFGKYKKTMDFYNKAYSDISTTVLVANTLDDAVMDYVEYGGKYYLDKVTYNYDSLVDKIKTISNNRDSYSSVVRDYIDNVEMVTREIEVIIKNFRADTDDASRSKIYSEKLFERITRVEKDFNFILKFVTEAGLEKYNKLESRIVVTQVLVVVAVLVLCLAVYLLWLYYNRNVAVPVSDIYEWSTMLGEGYYKMDDLNTEGDSELTELAKSFNMVKAKLAEATKLKDEYVKATEKIKDIEEHKKKFVKQLYDEKRDKEAITNIAKCDGLTGLYNRRTFDEIVEEFFIKRPAGVEGALFLIDMDNFKNINDSLGHLAGDEALKLLAGVMRIVFTGAYLGRYGGDEFIVFCSGNSNTEELKKYAEALCKKMDTVMEKEGKKVQMSVSVGISKTEEVNDYSELYRMADKALYFSKENGRNRYTFSEDLED